jgi:hypothetical protein
MVRDASALLARLLDGGHSTIAFRLAGAFRNGGRSAIADEILKTMATAGYNVRETDPFADRPELALPSRQTSPYVNRIRLLWHKMRETVLAKFPKAPGLPRNTPAYMKAVDEAYVSDAYHSLSIEGYRVTPDLIERVRCGAWNPDRDQNVMMGAGGYPWTVIPVAQRKAYLAALEKASVGEDIGPFAEFLARLVEKRLAGEPLPEVPKTSA